MDDHLLQFLLGLASWLLVGFALDVIRQGMVCLLGLALKAIRDLQGWLLYQDISIISLFLVWLALLFFPRASASCVGDEDTVICGEGGLCDLTIRPTVEQVILKGTTNLPTLGSLTTVFPAMKVRLSSS